MLGFRSFYNARRVLIGIELMQKLVKGQYRVPSRERHLIDIWRAALAARRNGPSMQQNPRLAPAQRLRHRLTADSVVDACRETDHTFVEGS